MHHLSISRTLPFLAIILHQVNAQFPGPASNFVPAVCVPPCTTWSDTMTTCQANGDLDLQCICKQPWFDVYVQCGLCSADPANPLPPGIPESDRIGVADIQLTYDVAKAECDAAGYSITPVNLATATFAQPTTSSTSSSTSERTTSPSTSRPPATTSPTTSKPPSNTRSTSNSPPTDSPTNNPTNTGGSPSSHIVPMLSISGLIVAMIPLLLL